MHRIFLSCQATVAVLAGLLMLSGAAHAQEKAADAKSSPAAVLLYQDAANFQNNGAFELAIEEWGKFLKAHPADPLAAKAQYYLGVCQLQTKKYEPAAAAFAAVIKNHPKFELLEDAHLNLALSQYSLAVAGNAAMYSQAVDSFATLVKQFPKGKYVAEALFYQGESLYALDKKPEAVAAYDKLVQDFAKSPRRAEALYALGATLEELNKHAEAATAFDTFLKEFAEHSLVPEVRLRKAETLLQRGEFAAAEKLLGELAAVKDSPQAGQAAFRQAYALARQSKFGAAADLYARVATDFEKAPFAAEATMAAARCYFQAEKFTEATTWLTRAVAAKDAHSAEAAHWLCRLLLREKKPAEAVELAAMQLKAGGKSPFLANLQLDEADALFEIPARRAESLPKYVKLATADAKHELAPQALYNAAFTAMDLKDYAAGLQHATAFIAAYPQDSLLADAKYVAAECNLFLKKYPEAEAAYSELIEHHPKHADVDNWRLRQGLVLYVQKKYPETIASLEPIAARLKSPDAVAEAQFLLGASQFHSDKFAAAIPSLTASLAANPKWRQADEALLLLARAQRKQDQNKPADENLRRLIADYPESGLLAEAHYRLGEASYAADDFKAAVAEYGLVATKWAESPFAPYALYGQGWAQLKNKEFPAATTSFTTLLDKHAEHTLAADARLGRALSRRQAGDYDGTIADVEAYLKTNPAPEHKSDALYGKGLAEVALKKFDAAVTTLSAILKDHPQYAATDKVLYEIGWAYKSQDKHAEAVPSFARLAAEFPDSPLALESSFHVAEDQYDAKSYADAAKTYSAVKAKAPAGELGEKAAYKLGWSLYQQKDYAAAMQAFSEQVAAYSQGPLAADGAFMKAECLFRQEDYKAALPAYQAAAKLEASTPTIEALTLLHAGQSASQLKEWKEGLDWLTQVAAKFPDSPLLAEASYEMGWAKQQSGNVDEAVKDYETAAERSRDHVGARARFMLGEIQFERKQHDAAIREFQRAMFGFGGENASSETKNWQAKAGYEAGRCAQVQIMAAKDAAAKAKLVADAKRFFTFVVEKHPQHELAAEAQKQLALLAKL